MIAFEKWCASRGEQPIPASPTIIARFIHELQDMGIEHVFEEVEAIGRSHWIIGLPDPTCGPGLVTQEINRISKVTPPRSWRAEARDAFMSLPWPVQVEIGKREAERDREVRRLQNEVAELKRAETIAA
jgi:hypothetical protein